MSCPCGGIILADTEDWAVPLCYSCFPKEYEYIRAHNDELKEWFMDALGQGCGIYNREKDRMEYDHMCLSTWEHGIRMALENGWITKDQVLR